MPDRLATPERVVLLLSLVPYLVEHGETPLGALAEAFGVDVALMRELVEFLGTAGAPGETNTYQDEDLFDIDWAALEDEGIVRLTRSVVVEEAPRFSALERAALIAGLHALTPILPEAERERARSAAQKLGEMRPDRSAEPHGAAGETPVVEKRSAEVLSAAAGPEDPLLALVVEAIESGDRIDFVYQDLRGLESSRTVEPIALVQSATGWYLRAFCLARAAERTFALDGMREARLSPSPVRDDPGPTRRGERAGVPAQALGSSESPIPARLRVRESALHRVQGFAPRVLGPAGDGWVRVDVKLAYPAAAVRMVQAAPGDVIVDTPSSARAAVLNWVERGLAQYDA